MKHLITLFLALSVATPALAAPPTHAAAATSGPSSDTRGRAVDWKLLFNQLFAQEMRKEYGDAALPDMVAEHTYYSPLPFDEAIRQCASAGTSKGAFETRQRIYEGAATRARISTLDFTQTVGASLRADVDVNRYLSVIEANAERPIDAGENFFGSTEGANMVQAIRAAGSNVAFVLVPGYAAHRIKHNIFEEIVRDANLHYGRTPDRPVLSEQDGIEFEFEDHHTYYASGNTAPRAFDILHPAGWEMGNTTGGNAETTDLMADWIRSLPAQYKDTKFIMLGYSKGAPIVLDIVNRHPDLSPRIIGYVTFGGVVQGTNVARTILDESDKLLGDRNMGEMVDRLREEDPESLGRILSPLFSHMDLSILTWPRLRAVFDVLGYDLSSAEKVAQRILDGREIRELISGAVDMSPEQRTRWNLLHLDNETFKDPAFIFNLSALTNIQDFTQPRSLMAPILTSTGEIDWKQFSLDSLFLYTSSIAGFQSAPGGLFDTQVELGNTKSPHVDSRSLSESLTGDELAAVWADAHVRAKLHENGVDTFEAFSTLPRNQLTDPASASNLDELDLGEFRGHHWSLFVQALRPPPEISEDHAVWSFPRKAYMRALLQTMAFYELVQSKGLS